MMKNKSEVRLKMKKKKEKWIDERLFMKIEKLLPIGVGKMLENFRS